MTNAIRYLKIANYRSIDVLELRDIQPFSVFAGPNGAGKTNFFEALDFVNWVIQFGVHKAIKKHGGFKNIHCWKRNCEAARVFEFEIKTQNSIQQLTYRLTIDQLDTSSPLKKEEILLDDNDKPITEQNIVALYRESPNDILRNQQQVEVNHIFRDTSIVPALQPVLPFRMDFFNNFRLYRINPQEAKRSVENYDDSELSYNGRNLAAVLNRLEKNAEIRETLLEWMELIVPGLEQVHTESERLTGSTVLTFQEKGLKEVLPAHLISDGTIYLLSVLVAILDRPEFGITLIEEPERGLHPQAVMELVDGFREQATYERPIWVTTHNEALVRCLKNYELWLVDKSPTKMKQVQVVDKLASSLDQAWLTNALGGGLPW
jgi:predicted ATPase